MSSHSTSLSVTKQHSTAKNLADFINQQHGPSHTQGVCTGETLPTTDQDNSQRPRLVAPPDQTKIQKLEGSDMEISDAESNSIKKEDKNDKNLDTTTNLIYSVTSPEPTELTQVVPGMVPGEETVFTGAVHAKGKHADHSKDTLKERLEERRHLHNAQLLAPIDNSNQLPTHNHQPLLDIPTAGNEEF